MKEQTEMLGHQDKKKRIERLLRKAGEDTLINRVIEAQGEQKQQQDYGIVYGKITGLEKIREFKGRSDVLAPFDCVQFMPRSKNILTLQKGIFRLYMPDGPQDSTDFEVQLEPEEIDGLTGFRFTPYKHYIALYSEKDNQKKIVTVIDLLDRKKCEKMVYDSVKFAGTAVQSGISRQYLIGAEGSLLETRFIKRRNDVISVGDDVISVGTRKSNPDKPPNDFDIIDMDLSKDGKYVAVAGEDHFIRVYEHKKSHYLEPLEEVAHIQCPDDLEKIAFSPNGRYLAAASVHPYEKRGGIDESDVFTLRVFVFDPDKDMFTARLLKFIDDSKMPHIDLLGFAPDSYHLVAANNFIGPLSIYKPSQEKRNLELAADLEGKIIDFAFDSSGKYLAFTDNIESTLALYEVKRNIPRKIVAFPPGALGK